MRWLAPCTLLLLCLVFPAVPAADITLAAGQQDYYFLTGQPVEIPLAVTSGYPDHMPATIRFSTDAQLQKTGVVMISTQNRVFTQTVPGGQSFLNLTMASSQVSRDYKVHVSLYYRAPSPVNTSLPEFFIHIVTDPGLMKNSPVPLASTSQPESGEIPSKSSVSAVEQTVSTRQQMGSDSTGQQSIASGQPQPDTDTARQQQQRDKEKREQEQSEFDGRLEKDPLFLAVNETLGAEGFTRQTLDTQPAGNETGTFSLVYRKGAEDQVVVQGSMQGGVVPSVREVSNAEITADPTLDADTTFQSFARTLAGQGYGHTETAVNRTLSGAMANITYTTPEGKKAYVNATTEQSRVIQVTMEQETGPGGSSLVPILMLATVILTIFGGYVYWRYEWRGLPGPEAQAGSPQPDFNHRKEADRLLMEAEQAFDQRRNTDAYGKASRALRGYLSHEYGNHGEVTTTEIVSLLRISGRDTRNIEAMLRQCDEVVFARQEPDPGEFSSMILQIREIISTP
ncbi:MAG: hypothetical protein Q8R70_09105 [Methanoregula sp.]|nr:hypothetical protein [Methanoregula sp.]